MKALSYYILILLTVSLASCTEIIDIDLPTAEPRLVVEANIDFNRIGTTDSVFVKLTLTTDYFNPVIPPANKAVVSIQDKQGNRFMFQELAETGIYYSTEINKPLEGETFKLNIEYDNDLYEATETFINSPEIVEITQSREKYFEDTYYVLRIYYQDVPRANQNLNYYYLYYNEPRKSPSLSVLSNEFSKGNRIESMFIADKDIQPGEKVDLELGQISRNYFDFALRLSDAINNGGGPFQVPSGKIVGNVKNLTTPKKEALGYFRVLEKEKATHTIFEQSKP